MKSFGFFIFVFLAIPGSGQLVWDGLPFSTRAEFMGLALFVVVMFSRDIREGLHRLLKGFRWRGLLKPILVVFCVAKFATFSWSPLSAGFGSCYRSLYEPLKDLMACEKSYESPFIQGHGLPSAKVSRVDSTVDFGNQMFDWRLPFMNESHRFPVLWLSRLPFTATYRATLENQRKSVSYLPVRAIGQIRIQVNGELVANETNYDRHFLTVVEIPSGTSELQFDFRYSDDNASKLPDSPPLPRGPYAQLKIGKPASADQLLSRSNILIFGSRTSAVAPNILSDVKIFDRNGKAVSYIDNRLAPPQDDSDPPLRREFELEFALPADALEDAPLNVFGTIGNKPVMLAILNKSADSPLKVDFRPVTASGFKLSAILTTESTHFDALKPGLLTKSHTALKMLLLALDLISLLIITILAITVIWKMRLSLLSSLGIGGLGWIAVNPVYNSLPAIFGGGRELVIPYLAIAALIVAVRQSILRFPIAYLLPIAAVLSAQKVFDHVYYNHPREGDDWWGKLIFLWRDSDWYVNHGNARAVFVESFFRGGESVFYARMGPRYLIFFGQFLLGENDILIGLLSMTTGFMVLFFLVARFAAHNTSRSTWFVGFVVSYLGMIFLGDQIITAFGFLVTSEFTTWCGLLGVTAFLMHHGRESRVWVTVLFASVLAVLIHFRPNILFVCLALFLLVLLKVDRRNTEIAARHIAWGVSVFLTILPISLIHNMYYGGRFVPFTENAAETVAVHKRFSWTGIWSDLGVLNALQVIWEQTRVLMYWVVPGDPSLAIFFWGSQLLLAWALGLLAKYRQLFRRRTLIVVLPLTYVVPMASYNLTSYFPRHIVTASLLCLCSAVLIWPCDSGKLERPDSDKVYSS